jgi:hypothetical protein
MENRREFCAGSGIYVGRTSYNNRCHWESSDHSGHDVPYTDFLARPTERTIKGYDRGPMITEPNNKDLENWLHKHGFLDKPYKR